MSIHLFKFVTSPFFRREIEGVANQQLKPPQSPFEKGGSKKTAIYGWTLASEKSSDQKYAENVLESMLDVDPLTAHQAFSRTLALSREYNISVEIYKP